MPHSVCHCDIGVTQRLLFACPLLTDLPADIRLRAYFVVGELPYERYLT